MHLVGVEGAPSRCHTGVKLGVPSRCGAKQFELWPATVMTLGLCKLKYQTFPQFMSNVAFLSAGVSSEVILVRVSTGVVNKTMSSAKLVW